jgi:tetraacyldisaccharide-1-P 4'-kinase
MILESQLVPKYFTEVKVVASKLQSNQLPLKAAKPKTLVAFCGIANPNCFFKTLEMLDPKDLISLPFMDHHRYTKADLKDIASSIGNGVPITTEKDYYRSANGLVKGLNMLNVPTLWVLCSKLEITSGKEDFEGFLEAVLFEKDRSRT